MVTSRPSIARSLRLALTGLTVVLAAIAALGVARLLDARQRYEDVLASSAAVSIAAANLTSAGIVEEEALRIAASAPTDAHAGLTLRAASAGVRVALERTRSLTREDPTATGLVVRQLAALNRARQLAAAGRLAEAAAPGGPLTTTRAVAAQLQDHEVARRNQARSRDRSDSSHAFALVLVASALALLGGLLLVSRLVASMRSPLAALVGATRAMASGDLSRRVTPRGPAELRELAESYNAMAGSLAAARARIDDERRRLAITIESLGDGLIVTEADGDTVAAVNPRGAELVPALRPGVRLTDSSLLPPMREALAHEIEVDHEDRTLAVTAVMLGGEADGVVWTLRDMSERARLERAKTDFVATASHELRSPLTSIKGFVELLERSGGNMTDRQREFIDIVTRSTDRLVELVNDLLDVARIEADRVEIDMRPVDVAEAIGEVAELMGPRIAGKQQSLSVELVPALPPILGDAARMRQILANLLTNAHLYTPEGGHLRVAAAPDRASVRIVVADDGPGIPPEEQARVFERFFRGRDGGAAGPGTGLGLPIVKSLVELHGGAIELDSTPGTGTSFTMRLPVALPGADGRTPFEAIRGRRVLVLDDELELGELIAGQLAAIDVQTTVVTNGEDALAELRSGDYDAMTLDVLMPGMDGFEVLSRIRADPATRSLPIVFISVFTVRRELAGEWVVPKPIDADDLRGVLAAAVSSARSRAVVVAREELRDTLQPALLEVGIDHEWVSSGAAAARLCRERRFELALVDVGLRNPRAVLRAIDLRGRRVGRSVVLFSDEADPTPDGMAGFGLDVVPVDGVAAALLAAMREQPAETD